MEAHSLPMCAWIYTNLKTGGSISHPIEPAKESHQISVTHSDQEGGSGHCFDFMSDTETCMHGYS